MLARADAASCFCRLDSRRPRALTPMRSRALDLPSTPTSASSHRTPRGHRRCVVGLLDGCTLLVLEALADTDAILHSSLQTSLPDAYEDAGARWSSWMAHVPSIEDLDDAWWGFGTDSRASYSKTPTPMARWAPARIPFDGTASACTRARGC
ncbi:hypothetical protein DFH09DRAFT_527883 [Mycena vulgaris]|nr:hypothetical protein DFH09DRAFT_527883 [Mycena vulgaris]